jgi:hypothetical protein
MSLLILMLILTTFAEMVSPYNKPTPDGQALVKQMPKVR